MQVLLESRRSEALARCGAVVRRADFVLCRLTRRLSSAPIRLTDLNGPRVGVDKRCRVGRRAPATGPVVLTAMALGSRATLETPLARVAHALRRGRRLARGLARTAAVPPAPRR